MEVRTIGKRRPHQSLRVWFPRPGAHRGLLRKILRHENRTQRQDRRGTLVLRMRAGARLVYKLVDQLDERIAGHSPWWDMHTAFTVRDEEYFPNYRRMWESLPEEAGAKEHLNDSRDKEDNFPARTGLHRSPVGYKWKEIYQRGDEFYDWDGHAFHFIGGIPKNADGSLACTRRKNRMNTCASWPSR